jgi:hypothetical protein
MSFGRTLGFTLLGYAATNIASYQLGKHRPHGFFHSPSTSEDIKRRTQRAYLIEAPVLLGMLLLEPEAAITTLIFILPLHAYTNGRRHAVKEQEAQATVESLKHK